MKKFHGSNVPRPRMKKMIPTKQPLDMENKETFEKIKLESFICS